MGKRFWIRTLAVLLVGLLGIGVFPVTAQEQEPHFYVITTQDRVNGRACPQLTCEIVQRFYPGTELAVIEIVQGDTVNGSNQWLHVSMDGVDAYVHSSLATPLQEPAPAPATGRGARNPTTHFLQGLAHLNHGEYELAIAEFDEYIRLVPDDPAGYVSRGMAYAGQEDYARAIDDYDEALRLDPEYVEAYSSRGAAYLYLGDITQASADVSEALRLDPDNPILYANRGYVYAQQEDYEQAIADYNQAIRLAPHLAYAYYLRGEAYLSSGETERGLSDLNKAIQLDPEYADAYFLRGLLYYEFYHENDLALADLYEYLRLVGDEGDPDMIELVNDLIAEIQEELGQTTSIAPGAPGDSIDAAAHYNQRVVYYEQGKHEQNASRWGMRRVFYG